ncbi:hypothetical protein [Roseibium sp. TrichSKD4]|uniref:hypothetical protein n=1 Tax=Roseibium sp. TrichSKD4 TaxID=744980 RepID=UPI00059048B0|nr:hypothetical protein [Roseibium sp. TrichSKD4]
MSKKFVEAVDPTMMFNKSLGPRQPLKQSQDTVAGAASLPSADTDTGQQVETLATRPKDD